MESEMLNKNFFFNNYTIDIFVFVTAIILLLDMIVVMYILCKHMKLKTLVICLALKVKVLLLYSATRSDIFSSTLQP